MCVSDDDCGHRYLNGNILPPTSSVQQKEGAAGQDQDNHGPVTAQESWEAEQKLGCAAINL